MSSVTLKSIHKSFGSTDVLKDINLEIKNGEFLVLVGPSGCGKSTTLRLVAGLEAPTSGDICIDKARVNSVDPADRDIAMVFQNYALYPNKNVFDNMAFGLKIRKEDPNLIHSRVFEAAEILKIEDLLKRKPKELSGGQRQRVALGRALVRKPRVFLFDEPLSNLDAKLRSEMRIEIKRLHQLLKTTMIYVTHDQVEALTMGDRIAVMNRGIIEQLDTPNNCYFHPVNTFVAGFIGSPQMNFIEGTLAEEHSGKFSFSSGNFKIQLGSLPHSAHAIEHVILGIRPEDIGQIKPMGESRNDADVFSAKIEITEPLGSTTLTHLIIGEHHLTASFDGGVELHAGDTISVSIDPANIYLFDAATGKNISDDNL